MKKVKIANNGVYILDEELKKKLNKSVLSASMINSWLQSPGDWILNKFIFDLVKKEETPHLRRGNWFHSIMEDFFRKESDKRTLQELKESIRRVTENDYSDLKTDEDIAWIKNVVRGYSNNWLKTAPNEKVAKLFIMGENKEGLEFPISVKIGNTKRNIFGFIDKIIEGDNGLIVQDWKTGKTISNFDPTKKISENNSFDYWRQQTLYSLMLEKQGAIIEKASLIFPAAETPQEVFIPINNKKVREQVIKDVELVDKELSDCIDNNYFFPFKKGKYNGWASYLCGMGNAYKPKIFEDKFLELAEIEE